MRKQLRVLGLLSAAVFTLGITSGCRTVSDILDGVFGSSSYYKVSSLEELYAMETDKNYQLMCDLDLGGREWFPLSVARFEGNGHTISNGVINSTSEKSINSVRIGFFKNAIVSNVIFDSMNYTVTTSGAVVEFGLATGYGACNNVKVANSMALISISDSFTDVSAYYIGGISGHCLDGLSQCSISDSTVVCNILSSVRTGYIGGIIGGSTGDVTLRCRSSQIVFGWSKRRVFIRRHNWNYVYR